MQKNQENNDVIFTEQQISQRIIELGQQITQDYQNSNRPLSAIAMLKGSTYFLADLTRAIKLPLKFDFMAISQVKSATGIVQVTRDIEIDIAGNDVLVVEEIVRSGLTTHYMLEHLEKFKPASINLVAMFANPDQLMINLPLNYIGFEIDYTRIVGYGLDYKEQYRNLSYIKKMVE
ncbi:MAG TPA: hypoxanthine phosphoribosyltransferase [Clostridiaceae bacterium]|nr:hypoxanthine phosphoribosyltransferase [Clostridiaceae bacterium]